MSGTSDTTSTITITRRQQRFTDWLADVLVDIVVLNLFVEFVDTIVIDSFWISILTAVLLKLMLDAVMGLEHRVRAYFAAREGRVYRALGLVSVFAILFLSKFVILEAVNLVFGKHVELGHLVEIVAIIVGMLGARVVLQIIYRRLGEGVTDRG